MIINREEGRGNKTEDSGLNAEEFREMIRKNYKENMEDCQIPTGALAVLNPAELFAFHQWEENKSLRQDLIVLSIAIEEIHKSLSEVTRAINICQECSDITKIHRPYRNEMERMGEACTQEGCDKNMRCYGGGVNKDLLCMAAKRRFKENEEE